MSPEHIEAACNLIDPEHAGIIPKDTVLVQDVIGLLATQLAEVDRLTQKLEAAQHSLIESGTEHARDLGHLADRNRELAERTRERDDAQRTLCERQGGGFTPQQWAMAWQWPHLYPEESGQ